MLVVPPCVTALLTIDCVITALTSSFLNIPELFYLQEMEQTGVIAS